MDTNITELLGGDKLPPEIVSSIQEAFDKKVTVVRDEAEAKLREEFARRYEHDKENLVEAIDRMLADALSKQEAEKNEAIGKFNEARTAFRRAIKESRTNFRSKLTEQTEVARKVVTEKLKDEVLKLREAKKAITAERLAYADKLAAVKESLTADQGKRLKKIDEFVCRQVSKELKEFLEDHRALVATRVKLVSESRERLKLAQTRFVKEAAKKVERVITENLKREMSQLHEDLEKNRQNMFGRRIFEAVAAEYMTSYLTEGTEIRKLQQMVETKDQALAETSSKLDEAVKVGNAASRKVRLAEDRAQRTKVMGELLSNLRGDKRQVMEGMLETVKTEALRESFNKLLPVVLEENNRPKTSAGKKVLNETSRTPSKQPATMVTGGQRANRLAEAAEAEAMQIDPDIAQVIRLAGIHK